MIWNQARKGHFDPIEKKTTKSYYNRYFIFSGYFMKRRQNRKSFKTSTVLSYF